MAIELYTQTGRIGLVAKCDKCEKLLTANNANIIWGEMSNKDGESPRHYIGCNICSRIIEKWLMQSKDLQVVGMIPLDIAIIQLEKNVKLDRNTAVRNEKLNSILP